MLRKKNGVVVRLASVCIASSQRGSDRSSVFPVVLRYVRDREILLLHMAWTMEELCKQEIDHARNKTASGNIVEQIKDEAENEV